jgi:hypothetical protein
LQVHCHNPNVSDEWIYLATVKNARPWVDACLKIRQCFPYFGGRLSFLFKVFSTWILLQAGALHADSFAGQLKASVDDFPYHLGPPTQDLTPYVTAELSDKYKFSKKFRFQWKAYALTNTSTHYSPENFYGDIPEAFFEYKATHVAKLRIGMNTLNWGVVDISSPSDVVNTLMIFNPMKIRKQGAPIAELLLGEETLNLDLIYIPVQRSPQLPSQDSRWLPRQYLSNVNFQGTTIQLLSFIEYNYEPTQTLDHALNNNYGAKLASHLGSWDFQVTHYVGAATSPKARLDINIQNNLSNNLYATSPIGVHQVNYLVETTGFGFVWAGEKWIFRGETAYSNTRSSDDILQPWAWSSVLAAETNVPIGSRTLTLLGQAYYTKNPQAADNMISSAYRIFDQTGMLGARFAYSDELTITVSSLYQTNTRGLFWMAGFDQKLSDHLRWGLSWTNFSAPTPGLMQTYAKDDHATLDMSYFF